MMIAWKSDDVRQQTKVFGTVREVNDEGRLAVTVQAEKNMDDTLDFHRI